MYGRYKIATPAANSVLNLMTDVKPALNINAADTYWDDYLTALIAGVEDEAEKYTRRAFLTSAWDVYFDSFARLFQIIKAPVTEITHIKYQDPENATQTLDPSNYSSDFVSEDHAARVKVLNAPSIYTDGLSAVNIRFSAGWSSAANVPALLKSAMIVRINTLYKTRQTVFTGTQVNELPLWYEKMLSPYKIDW